MLGLGVGSHEAGRTRNPRRGWARGTTLVTNPASKGDNETPPDALQLKLNARQAPCSHPRRGGGCALPAWGAENGHGETDSSSFRGRPGLGARSPPRPHASAWALAQLMSARLSRGHCWARGWPVTTSLPAEISSEPGPSSSMSRPCDQPVQNSSMGSSQNHHPGRLWNNFSGGAC